MFNKSQGKSLYSPSFPPTGIFNLHAVFLHLKVFLCDLALVHCSLCLTHIAVTFYTFQQHRTKVPKRLIKAKCIGKKNSSFGKFFDGLLIFEWYSSLFLNFT